MFSEDSQPHQPNSNASEPVDINILLADSWNQPLWKRLLGELRDKFAAEKLAPLELTSRPVDVGMIASDRLSLPWYRTVFTNLGDVVSPETLPPLELESTPVDVGELIADQMSHPWWTSLLRSLADAAAPERMPPLQLTSKPMDPGLGSDSMLLPRWSSVISTPKVFLPDKPKADLPSIPLRVPPKPKPDPVEIELIQILQTDLKRDIASSIFRQRIWISLAVLELALLFVTGFWWK